MALHWPGARRRAGKRSFYSTIRLELDGKTYREHAADQALQTFRYKIHPDNIVFFEAIDGSTWFFGRYELKDDTLRLCFPGPLDPWPEPPKAMESPKGSKVTLSEWKRAE
jgi:hypothetical protein